MKILFIRFSSMGDTILTTGVMSKVREALPDAEITVLTYEEFSGVFRRLNFDVNIYSVRRKLPPGEYIAFLRKMPHFDFIFDLHASTRSFIARMFLHGQKHVYKKQSLARRLYVKFRLCKGKLTLHTVEKYAQAVFPVLSLAVPQLEELRPVLKNGRTTNDGKVVLHPFASRYTKAWPYFEELAAAFIHEGKKVFVIGKGDFPPLPGLVRVAAQDLEGMFDALADARLVVSNDSGPMHAAVALNRNVVAIFGSTTRELGFFPLFKGVCVVEKELVCRPCHVHGLSECPLKHFNCMRGISVREVVAQG